MRKPGEARLDRLLPLVGDLPLAPPRGAGAPKGDQAQRRERSQEPQTGAERFGERDRDAVDDGERGGGDRQLSRTSAGMGEQNKNTFDRACPADYQSTASPVKKSRMALRPIIVLPDPKLRLVSRKIERVDDDLRRLIDDMIETMHDAPGVGLAAIQIAEPIRLLVVDTAKKEETPAPQVFINPEIVWSSEERSTYEEGCLSIPEYYAEVERPASVRARALDREGKLREVLAEGLLATVLQHEIDHLNGVLFIDHISKLKRDRVIKKFQKAAKRAGDGSHVL